jgi:TetR/AcrR family transcriptional regulator, tetracycline repressor protein
VGRRAAWGSISRERIVDAALKSVRSSGGFEQTTIRSLAADLGVAPMSLYRHVRDKDDLLDDVVDHLLRRAWRPSRHTRDWRAWVAEAADRLRRLLVNQPAALYVYLRHPVVSPAAVERMRAVMDRLRQAGFDEDSAERAYGALQTYTIGFAALEASRAGWSPPDDRPDSLSHRLAAYTTPEQFAVGLRYLLDGIAARRTSGAAPGGSARR